MSCYHFYFSPTGGTKRVGDAVAEGWGEAFAPVDLMVPAAPQTLTAEDVCLISVPAYGGRVPGVAVERLRAFHGSGARAVLIAVFGNRAIDDTLLELYDELTQAGFRCIAGIEAVARHSLVPCFAAGRPDEADVEELHGYGKKIRAAAETEALSCAGKLPGNRPYRVYKGAAMKPIASEECIDCGLCAAECPVGAIPAEDCRVTDPETCISCMHCAAVCPQNARALDEAMVQGAEEKMRENCTARKENKLYL